MHLCFVYSWGQYRGPRYTPVNFFFLINLLAQYRVLTFTIICGLNTCCDCSYNKTPSNFFSLDPESGSTSWNAGFPSARVRSNLAASPPSLPWSRQRCCRCRRRIRHVRTGLRSGPRSGSSWTRTLYLAADGEVQTAANVQLTAHAQAWEFWTKFFASTRLVTRTAGHWYFVANISYWTLHNEVN